MAQPYVLVLLWVATVYAPIAAAEPAPRPWMPQESWPGGQHYDARLDRPVKVWLTGTPLARVFASIQQQTGVAIGFFPADDDNARICVNVYLNPAHPPTLRDLMGMTGITSTSFMRYITHRLPGIRITAGGHPVPDWVDQAIEREKE